MCDTFPCSPGNSASVSSSIYYQHGGTGRCCKSDECSSDFCDSRFGSGSGILPALGFALIMNMIGKEKLIRMCSLVTL